MTPDIPLKNKIDKEALYKISRMKERIKPTRPHGHEGYFEFIYLSAGAGYHYIDFEKYEVVPGALFFMYPGQIHHWEFTEIPKGYVLICRREFLMDPTMDVMDLVGWGIPSFFSLAGQDQETAELFQKIEREYQEDLDGCEQIIKTYIKLLLLKIKRLAQKSSPVPDGHQLLVNNFKQLLDADFSSKRFVKEYADLLHVTPKHLNETCKKLTGSTASKIIQERIILEARRMLLYTEKSIAEIAFSLAFTDPSHFGKFYKKITGTTPQSFRATMFDAALKK